MSIRLSAEHVHQLRRRRKRRRRIWPRRQMLRLLPRPGAALRALDRNVATHRILFQTPLQLRCTPYCTRATNLRLGHKRSSAHHASSRIGTVSNNVLYGQDLEGDRAGTVQRYRERQRLGQRQRKTLGCERATPSRMQCPSKLRPVTNAYTNNTLSPQQQSSTGHVQQRQHHGWTHYHLRKERLTTKNSKRELLTILSYKMVDEVPWYTRESNGARRTDQAPPSCQRLRQRHQLGNQLAGQLGHQQLGNQLRNQLRNQLGDQLGDQRGVGATSGVGATRGPSLLGDGEIALDMGRLLTRR